MAMALTSNASSSMASSHPCFSYDVFLSFRGEDTRKTFTDHLYTALKQAGIRTFRDDDAMDRGKLLEPELKKAIRQSAISIIVFSRNYASSKWCLDEVLTIIEEQKRVSSKHEVVPVFYNIEPSDVRNQTGSFEEAFGRYDDIIKAETNLQKKKEWLEKVKAWRVSLRTAGSLTGMVLTNGYEAEFIINVLSVIRKKLDYKALYIDEKLVGINDEVAEIESWLQDPSPNATILLVDGMGGIGKTTITKCIFNSNSHEYDASCFLAEINETSNQPNGLLRLQSQLLSTVLKSGHEETIWNVHEGTNKVANAICNKKVLLILDDVTTEEQLNALLGGKRFYPGSKVIITTRHKWLVHSFTLPPTVHTVTELCTRDSIELFSLYAFHQDQPTEPYIIQSELVVHHCMGLPLALKVLGSSLRGKSVVEWEDAMCKLEAIQHPAIQKVLRLSYDSLEDDTDKDLFLHIACFFVEDNKDYIVKILDQCNLFATIGIKNLMDRCLVYITNGKVGMHQLIKQMGQEVVRQESPKFPGKRSRLWNHEDCFNVLQEYAGTTKVEGFMFDMQKMKEPKSTSVLKMDNVKKRSFEEYLGNTMHGNETKFKIGALEKMQNIMLLQLNYVTFSGKYKRLPKKLRLLSWQGFSRESIPCDIPLEKLVVLDMRYSKLKCVWDDFKLIGSLKILNLGYCVELIKTPDFGGLPCLESLILKGCLSLTKVGESISHLKRLVLLDLTNCRSLRDIPCLPTSLLSLQMSGCPNLQIHGRVQWLDSISLSSLLVHVNISNCNLFDHSFPNDWSHLVSLEKLSINGNNITSLPKCIQSLPRLVLLNARMCSQIQSVIGLPKSLEQLFINDNMSLKEVQVQPTQRTSTTRMFTHGCPKLCCIEGRYKLLSMDKVDKKILWYMGLESIAAGEGIELDLGCKQEVLYEFGILSTIVSKKQIPSSFMYKERGPIISFTVPLHRNSSRISGMIICFLISPPTTTRVRYPYLKIEVYNETKELLWVYQIHDRERPTAMKKYGWLSLWRCGNLLEDGDEIIVHAPGRGTTIEECCINLLYEDEGNEEVDEEGKELAQAHHVSVLDQISWSDRMVTEISNYVHSGKAYLFRSVDPSINYPIPFANLKRLRKQGAAIQI